MANVPRRDPRRYWTNRRDNRSEKVRDNSFLVSAKWKKLRLKKLRRNPLCERCLEKNIHRTAEEVDHILSRDQRPDLSLRFDNLQSLCKSCHSAKTAREINRKKRRKQ